MKNWTVVSLAVLGLVACGKEEPKSASGATTEPKVARPEKIANGEPAVVQVKHVLIAFQGAERSESTRSREDAERLAYEVLGRARKGEDFDLLVKSLSDDLGSKDGKPYTLTNNGIEPLEGEFARASMVREFGDVSFRINVGEFAFAPYDPATSVFGYHIIKRVK
jgi:parvulin-like peptidyl-prolyl isomerase